jgi:membrane protein YdbS with pleckstrin-like domain
MTEVQQSIDIPILAESDPLDEAGLQPVDPAYAKVLAISLALAWLPVAIGATVVDLLIMPQVQGPVGLLAVLTWLLAGIMIVMLPMRRYARIGYHLGSDDLRVARGFFFRTDTIVPFVRVQHIDVGQGPIERRYGLSHLVVHTSGTHNSTVTLPGLPSATAAAMRETIRQHIQSDFA